MSVSTRAFGLATWDAIVRRVYEPEAPVESAGAHPSLTLQICIVELHNMNRESEADSRG